MALWRIDIDAKLLLALTVGVLGALDLMILAPVLLHIAGGLDVTPGAVVLGALLGGGLGLCQGPVSFLGLALAPKEDYG